MYNWLKHNWFINILKLKLGLGEKIEIKSKLKDE